MNLQLLSSSRFTEALSDIRAFKAELVIIDGLREGVSERILDLHEELQMIDSVSKCILLTDEDTLQNFNEGAGALFDEYVIYDDQLEQLFNKLAEYRIV